MTTYHTYKDPYPATLNYPNALQLESRADWPKTYRLNPNYDPNQGIHPPGPVYNADQTASQNWNYYWQQQQQQQPQAGYYVNGQYVAYPAQPGTSYSSPYYYYQPSTKSYLYSTATSASPAYNAYYYAQYQRPSYYTQTAWNTYSYMRYLAPTLPGAYPTSYPMMPGMAGMAAGMPMTMPAPNCPAAMQAQTAAAAATNAALAAMPAAPAYWVGGGQTDFAAQQAIIAAQMQGYSKPPPTQLAPYKPSSGTQFWCKELDGSWTLQSQNDILLGEVSPGHWERHATSGYFYWVRTLA